jgi:hypothetical protein
LRGKCVNDLDQGRDFVGSFFVGVGCVELMQTAASNARNFNTSTRGQ